MIDRNSVALNLKVTIHNTSVSRHSPYSDEVSECSTVKCLYVTECIEIAEANDREPWERYVAFHSGRVRV